MYVYVYIYIYIFQVREDVEKRGEAERQPGGRNRGALIISNTVLLHYVINSISLFELILLTDNNDNNNNNILIIVV